MCQPWYSRTSSGAIRIRRVVITAWTRCASRTTARYRTISKQNVGYEKIHTRYGSCSSCCHGICFSGSGMALSSSARSFPRTSGLFSKWKVKTASVCAVVSPPAPTRMKPSSIRRSIDFSRGGSVLSRSSSKIVRCDLSGSCLRARATSTCFRTSYNESGSIHARDKYAYPLDLDEECDRARYGCRKPCRKTHHHVGQPREMSVHDASFNSGMQHLVPLG
jgi:hypothetical protein